MELLAVYIMQALQERFLSPEMAHTIINAFLCVTSGGLMCLMIEILRKMSGHQTRVRLPNVIIVMILSMWFGTALALYISYYIDDIAYVLVPTIIALCYEDLPNAKLQSIIKVVTNIFVSVTKREKITTTDLYVRDPDKDKDCNCNQGDSKNGNKH